MKKMYKFVVVVAAAVMLAGCAAEQTKEDLPDPEPLVINTVERQENIILTVRRDQETVFQYAGDIELWMGTDGQAYGLIYLDKEVCQ